MYDDLFITDAIHLTPDASHPLIYRLGGYESLFDHLVSGQIEVKEGEEVRFKRDEGKDKVRVGRGGGEDEGLGSRVLYSSEGVH